MTPDAGLSFKHLRSVVGLDWAVSGFIDTLLEDVSNDADGVALVLNGDIFDFMSVDFRPAQDTFDGPPIDGSEEELYGLSYELSRSRWKLALISRIHRKTMKALARFVDHGGRLIFTVGNHDVDLWFEEIQRDLRDELRQHMTHPEGADQRVEIESWFHLSSPIVYIEHGHRFDPYTTFPDPLEPISRASSAQVAPNFAHFGLRYFSNRVRTFPMHDLDHKPWVKIVHWIRAHPLIESLRALKAAFAFFFRYWTAMLIERETWQREQAINRFARRKKLKQIADQHAWSLKRIQRLDAMKVAPVGQTLSMFLQALHLDRIALILGLLSFWIAMALSTSHGSLALGILLSLLATALWWWLDQSRPIIDLHPRLGEIAQEIGRIARVPVVIFGHTHQATCESLGNVIWLNPGSWEHVALDHDAEEPKMARNTVHFGQVCLDETGVSVELKWYQPKSRAHGLVRTRRATFRGAL